MRFARAKILSENANKGKPTKLDEDDELG